MVHEPLILLAEDNATDVFLFRRAYKVAGLKNPLAVVDNGQEVIDYLSGKPPYTNRSAHPIPGLLILDINMPLMNGYEALSWLRTHKFSNLPVVILSSSTLPSDLEKARQLGANDYRVKPIDNNELAVILRDLQHAWLT